VTTRKPVNREVYEGADMIALRLRAARKPAVIPFLEIPPEEIDLEPVTLEPVALTDAEPMPIMPLVVPASEILPFDDEEETAAAPTTSNAAEGKPTSAPTTPSEGLPLFGVGTILDGKEPGKRRR
jgi:hypothetical protein